MNKNIMRIRKSLSADSVLNSAYVLDDEALEHQEGSAAQLADLDFELQAANAALGKEEKTYGIFGPIYRFSCWYKSRVKAHAVAKKTYLILLVLTGWMGGHRYYEHRWMLGILYSAFFWTGVPLAMCLIDAMIVIPKKTDEQGLIIL